MASKFCYKYLICGIPPGRPTSSTYGAIRPEQLLPLLSVCLTNVALLSIANGFSCNHHYKEQRRKEWKERGSLASVRKSVNS